jgi:hypothetical protein
MRRRWWRIGGRDSTAHNFKRLTSRPDVEIAASLESVGFPRKLRGAPYGVKVVRKRQLMR